MKSQLHLLRLVQFPIFQQLQLEEALLRADTRNWCLLNLGSPDAIVMGISSQPAQWLNQPLFEKKAVPLIRRFSGGGTVYVDQNTCFLSWICQTEFLQISCCPSKIMEWSSQFYAPLLPHFRVQENDYIIGDRKFGGNAQYLCKNRWLHHSSLLWDFDPAKMDLLAMPPRTPQYRVKRSHADFLCTLKPYWGAIDQLGQALEQQIKSQFDVMEVSLEEALEITKKPHRKATQLIEC